MSDPGICYPGSLCLEDWGSTAYEEALTLQLEKLRLRQEGSIPDTLILTEHLPVFTLGVRKEARAHLLWREEQLEKMGIHLAVTQRGGDITYHGPGQLTVYPILDLSHLKDLHLYLRLLEEVIMGSIGRFGLLGGRREGKTGVWLEDRKIAAIGVAVKKWVTFHGFALNVNPNLNHFTGIIPCGITDGSVTSMERELGFPVDFEGIKTIVFEEFVKVFSPHFNYGSK